MNDIEKNTKSPRKRQSRTAKSGGENANGSRGKPGKGGSGKKYGAPSAKSSPYSGKKSNKPSKPIVEEIATDKPERIAKRIARAGLCSRRQAEVWINDGRVSVNGERLSSPALTVSLSDQIEVDGNPLPGRERTRLWLYHKPSGVLSTNRDPEGRPTLFEQLPKDLPRMLSIGRLDMNTEGLLLMTNDGGLARILELPSTGWLRRYRVRAHGTVDQAKLDGLKDGIAVDGVLYGSIEATVERQQGSNTWLSVALREGKNREIKNVFSAIGLEVNRLIRISYGPFQLGELGAREIQEIRGRTLRDQLGERLIKQAGADFNAPLNPKPAEPKDSGKSVGGKSAGGKSAGGKNHPRIKKTKKFARGTIAPGTMERLDTRKNTSSDGQSSFKVRRGNTGKPGSERPGYEKAGKPNRKPDRNPRKSK